MTPALGGVPWNPGDIAKLHDDLDAIFDGAPTLSGAHVGVTAVDTATGTVLYSRHADEAFQPASTLKLVVGSAAIDLLTPQFAPVTRIRVAAGNALTIVVDADPFFSLADVARGVGAIAAVPGAHFSDVAVEEPFDDSSAYPAGWTFDDFARDYAPAIASATLEENVVHVRAVASGSYGSAVVVSASPSLPIVAKDATSCSSSDAFLANGATVGQAESDDTLDVTALVSGCRELVGVLPSRKVEAIDVAVPDPGLYLARAFVQRLRSAGVSIDGSGRVARRPRVPIVLVVRDAPPVWSHVGLPLSAVMPRFWIPSDNFVGELLLLDLCPERGEAGARACGLDRERTWLRSIGVDPATTTLADGSGLSQYDRITPRDLVTILQHDWNGPNRQLVLDSLPIGGARGTIEGIAGTPVAGRVFAKTGSMMHVRGLAGYLATERHGAVTFAFNVDDWIGDYPALAATRAAVLSRIVRD